MAGSLLSIIPAMNSSGYYRWVLPQLEWSAAPGECQEQCWPTLL